MANWFKCCLREIDGFYVLKRSLFKDGLKFMWLNGI